MNKRQVRVLLIVGFIIGAVTIGPVIGAVASYLSTGTDFQGDVHVRAVNGPDVDAKGSMRVDDDSLFPDDNTVRLVTDEGNITLSSANRTYVTIPDGGINGTYTNTTNLNVTGADLTINPDDKQKVVVGGQADSFKFREMALDDGKIDFTYSGASGNTTVVVYGLPAGEKIDAIDSDTGDVLDTSRANSSGVLTLEVQNSKHNVELKESPEELYVYNETSPDTLVNNTTVEVTVFADQTTVTRSTTDGTINMSGLPTGQKLIIQAKADGYFERTIVIDSIYEQQQIFLLNKSTTSVEVRFVIDDKTGQFDTDSTEIRVLKPITQNNSTEYRIVAADYAGVNGLTTNLEEDARYRLVVRNDQGDKRVLGSYTASVSETVTLTIGEVQLGANDPTKHYQWDASFTNETGPTAKFEFVDDNGTTTDLNVVIHEYGNKSNEVYNSTFPGPISSLTITEPLPSDKRWVVRWEGERSGEAISGSRIIGPNAGWVDIGLDEKWTTFSSIGLLILIGGMFGGIRSDLGGVVVALVGGMLWFVGWLPSAVGGGAVVLGLAIPVLVMVRGGRR